MNFSVMDLCSKALNKIGASEILSFEDGTPESEISASLYPVVKGKLLSNFAWSFATKEISLNQLYENPSDEFSYCFLLPLDFLRAIKISSKSKYKILGNKLLTNTPKCTLTYIADVEEEFFSASFISALVYALAAEFALSLLDDMSKFNLLYKLYNNELKEARHIDSIQKTSGGFCDFSLIDVRR